MDQSDSEPMVSEGKKKMAEEVGPDLEELRNLQSIAKRPHSVNFFSSVIRTLEELPLGAATSVSTLARQYGKRDNDNVKLSQGPATLPTPTPISTAVSTPALHYETPGSFSLDQDNDQVKELTLDLEEIHHLQSIAKRPGIVNLISSLIHSLEKLRHGAATSVSTTALQYEKQDNDNFKLSQWAATLPAPSPISTAVSTPALHYEMPGSFSLDQDNDQVKLSQEAAALPTPAPISTAVSTPALHYETPGSFSLDQDNDQIKNSNTRLGVTETWDNISYTHLTPIMDKLMELIHYPSLAVVCKNWYNLVKSYHQNVKNSTPMLMIPAKTTEKAKLYSFSEKEYYGGNFSFPKKSKSCGVDGWLATIDGEGDRFQKISLLNPFKFNSKTIALPELNAVFFGHTRNAWGAKNLRIMKVLLSADPELDPENYHVLALFADLHYCAVMKGGQACWHVVMLPSNIHGAIFHKGEFHLLEANGSVFSVSCGMGSGFKGRYFKARLGYWNSWLVASTGADVYIVQGYTHDYDEPHFDDAGDVYFKHYLIIDEFRVYKLIFDEKDGSIAQITEVQSIGVEEAIFLDNYDSRCIIASKIPLFDPNSIYCDNGWEGVVVFDLGKRMRTDTFPSNRYHGLHPSSWIVPPVQFSKSFV